MKDWLEHNLLGLILFLTAPITIFIGEKFGMKELIEFGVASYGAAFYSFRTPQTGAKSEQ